MTRRETELAYFVGHKYILENKLWCVYGFDNWRDFLFLSTKKYDLEETDTDIARIKQGKKPFTTLKEIKKQNSDRSMYDTDLSIRLSDAVDTEIRVGKKLAAKKN